MKPVVAIALSTLLASLAAPVVPSQAIHNGVGEKNSAAFEVGVAVGQQHQQTKGPQVP